MSLGDRVDRLRQPEYTGTNRCLPCTVVNLALAVVVAGAVAAVSPVAAAAVLAVSVAAVYLRGYLVPGTPTLTKRYLPDAVLRLFDKHGAAPLTVDDDAALESFLLSVDAVEQCREGTDLCLTGGFRAAWNDRIARFRDRGVETGDVAALFDGLDVDPARVRTESRGDAYEAYDDDARVGQWESRAAYLADLAAEAELRERHSGWHRLDVEARMEVLGSLRLWLERCPSCDGPVTLGEDTVESCCRSIDVIAATCESCGARLFEAEFSPEAMATG
ncbi:hypothetical protein [Haloplanus pelagicus]|jgi:hypothetical protein|uniref:hypothetical protein n=1 Tax=Haloplanus pelagicus TaxID=2949995 RepID=UPI00203D7378|nr:hypothetical protein [Haloplanus sp. HW8-1]